MQERRMERVVSSDIFFGRDLRRLPGTDHSPGRGQLAGRLGIGGGDDPRRIPAAAGAGIPARLPDGLCRRRLLRDRLVACFCDFPRLAAFAAVLLFLPLGLCYAGPRGSRKIATA